MNKTGAALAKHQSREGQSGYSAASPVACCGGMPVVLVFKSHAWIQSRALVSGIAHDVSCQRFMDHQLQHTLKQPLLMAIFPPRLRLPLLFFPTLLVKKLIWNQPPKPSLDPQTPPMKKVKVRMLKNSLQNTKLSANTTAKVFVVMDRVEKRSGMASLAVFFTLKSAINSASMGITLKEDAMIKIAL